MPSARNKIASEMSFVTVLTLQTILGLPLSSLTKILKIAGSVAMPFRTDLISVTQG